MRIAIILLLVSTPVHAGEWALVVDTWSHHTAPAPPLEDFSEGGIPAEALKQNWRDWNEHNRSIGIEYTVSGERWDTVVTLAQYTDSYRRQARYGGVGWMKPMTTGRVKVSMGAHLLYFRHAAYRHPMAAPFEKFDFVMPGDAYIAPMPGISIRYGWLGANITVLPPMSSGEPWTGAAQLKLHF